MIAAALGAVALWRAVISRNMNSPPQTSRNTGNTSGQLADVVQFGNVLEKPQDENQSRDADVDHHAIRGSHRNRSG